MKNTRFIKKIFCIILSLTMLLSAVPMWSVSTSALKIGSKTYTNYQDGGTVRVTLDLYNATSVSGNTVTYVVDRAFYNNLSELGTLYNVKFEVNGIVVNTNITTTDYSVSNSGYRSNQYLTTNNTNNVYATDTASGTINGALPEAGQTKEFTITASISDTYFLNFPGYTVWPSDSTSASAKIVIKSVDTSKIQDEMKKCESLRESCWTYETWSALQSAILNANAVAENIDASSEQISSAASQIKSAREALIHNGSIVDCDYCCYGGGELATQPDCYYNVSYGPAGERNLYDLYLPKNSSGDTSMILYIHGGSWSMGSKEDFTHEAYNSCAQFGIATASVSYRYTQFPSVTAWEILDDIQTAVAHIKNFAKEKGLNITKMMVYGYSAGAHLSLMYGYTKKDVSAITPVCVFDKSGPAYLANDKYLEESSMMPALLSCISGFYFTKEHAIYAAPALLDVSPYSYVNENTIPTVINHGVKDSIVPFTDSVALNNRLNECGVEHEFIIFPNSDHGLESDPDCSVQMNDAFNRYVSKYLLDTVPQQVHNYVAEVKSANCYQEGYTKYTCTECGKYYLSDFVPKTHSNAASVQENIVPATCLANGGYDDVVYCTLCNSEVSRIHIQTDKLEHNPGSWETVTPATFESEGLEVQKCSVCKNVVNSRSIPMLAKPEISVKEDIPSDIILDNTSGLMLGVGQGETDLAKYFDLTNCVLEYTQTSSGFGTGSLVTVKTVLGTVLKTYTVVVYADGTGDGYVDAFDVSVASDYINNFDEPKEEAYMKAFDLVEDGYLDATDLAFVLNAANFE